MRHEQYKEWLYLSVFDEIGEDEKRLLAEHVASCGECQQERGEIVRMLESTKASGVGEPSEAMLQSARQSLRAALYRESVAHTAMRRPARRTFRGDWLRGYRAAVAAAAIASLGFLGGYLASGGSHPVSSLPDARPVADESYTGISNIRFLDTNAADGEVDIVYDQVRPMRLTARLDDERMREVLAYALLNDENPGVRLKAINAFETHARRSPPADMKQAFLEALNSDPNAGVRLQALVVLRRLPFDDDIKRTLLFALSHDDNPGIRIAVLNYLAEVTIDGVIPEEEMYDILNSRVTADRNSSVPSRPAIDGEEME